MARRAAVLLVAVFMDAPPACFAKETDHGTARPNLIIILTDDLGYGDVSHNGAEDLSTPNIDSLANDGMRFSQMRANCTVCSPTRAALMTGLFPDRAGVPGVIRTQPESSFGYLRTDVPTLADEMSRLGYHTSAIGKWHLGLESPNVPNERGFAHFHGFLGDMMDDYFTHLRHGNNYMRRDGQIIEPEGHATELFTDWAIEVVGERSRTDEPFFLYLAYNAPHFPIQPPPEFLDTVRRRMPDADPKRIANVALVEHLDENIGRLLTAIADAGIAEETLVALTSDNGGSLSHAQRNLPFRGGKQSHFEGGLRVPAVVRYPKRIQAGSVCDAPVMVFDWFPTCITLGGGEPDESLDALDMTKLLNGRGDERFAARDQYFVRREGNARYGGLAYHALVRDGIKIARQDPFSSYEIFDLNEDPFEENNLTEKDRKRSNTLKQAVSRQIQIGGRIPWQPPSSQ